MADETVIGGVIIPSASTAEPPSKAGYSSQWRRRRTNEYKANMPPSPLLSARNTSVIYLMVVWMVRVQKTSDTPPSTTKESIDFPSPTSAFMTYRGEVPMSP